MAGLSSAPQGDDQPVDHEKTMEKAYKQFKDLKKVYVNEKAFKELEGEELVVAKDWRNMSPGTRNLLVDGLIGIQKKLEASTPVNPVELDGFRTLEKVLPKVFGMTIDNVMNLRRGKLAEEQERGASAAEDQEVLKSLDDDLAELPSEAEGPQLDGVSTDELFVPPHNPQSPTEETFR